MARQGEGCRRVPKCTPGRTLRIGSKMPTHQLQAELGAGASFTKPKREPRNRGNPVLPGPRAGTGERHHSSLVRTPQLLTPELIRLLESTARRATEPVLWTKVSLLVTGTYQATEGPSPQEAPPEAAKWARAARGAGLASELCQDR